MELEVTEIPRISDLLYQLCSRYGQTALAQMLEVHPSQLSRWLSGENGILLCKVDKVLDIANYVLVPNPKTTQIKILQESDYIQLRNQNFYATKQWESAEKRLEYLEAENAQLRREKKELMTEVQK